MNNDHDVRESESRPAEWRVGDVVLDLYEVTDVLGEGGMGRVYKVHHRGWDIDLAVKTPRPDILATPRGLASFVREAETWVNLGLHPNTVNCYYVRPVDNIPRVFVEYVDGGSLADWIQTKKLYEGSPSDALERILDIAIQFAWGLAHAHAQGLVHRDIKPANVMMTAGGVAKVTDFGLARAGATAPDAPRTPAVNILVSVAEMTRAYCSPEQAARRPLTPKTDMWSWGLSVLQMFTGEVTWLTGQAAPEALEAYLETPRESAAESPPAMPPMVVELLRRCFSPNPDGRPADMREIEQALREAYVSTSGRAYPRELPSAATLTASDLNNRALSLLDLGRSERAAALWDRALAADPKHPESIYNRGLWMWRSATMTDLQLIASLETIGTTDANAWLAEVLLECGEADQARKLLAAVSADLGGRATVRLDRFARQARANPAPTAKLLKVPLSLEDLTHLEFSKYGATLMAATGCGVIAVWDWSHEKRCREIRTSAKLTAVALSLDGRRVLACNGPAMSLWDVESARKISSFRELDTEVRTARMLPDGCSALLGTRAGTIALWNVLRGERHLVFQAHKHSVRALCVSSDGRMAFSGAVLEGGRQWDIATGQRVRDFGTTSSLELALSRDDRLLAIAGAGKKIWSTDAPDGEGVVINWVGQMIGFLPDDECFVTLDKTGPVSSLRRWDVASGRCLSTTAVVADKTASLSPCGGFVASGGDHEVEVIALRRLDPQLRAQPAIAQVRPQLALETQTKHADALIEAWSRAMNSEDYVKALDLARRLRDVPGFGRSPKALDLWSQLARRCRRTALRSAWRAQAFLDANIVRMGPDGQFLIAQRTSGSSPGRISLIAKSGKQWERVLPDLWDVAISPDGQLVLVVKSQSVEVWSARDGQCLSICDESGSMRCVCFTPDARRLVGGMRWAPGHVSLWEADTGKCIRRWRGGDEVPAAVRSLAGGIKELALSPDGTRVVGCFYGSEPLRLWDVGSDERPAAFGTSPTQPNTLAWSPDNRWIAIAGTRPRQEAEKHGAGPSAWEDVVDYWDACTWQRFASVVGGGRYRGCCVTPDARWVVSQNGEVTRFWDVATRTWAAEIKSGKCESDLTLSSDARWLATAHITRRGYRIQVWELDWDLAACDPADWDEGARPWLKTFLTLHTPSVGQNPQWTDPDFDRLLIDLQHAGYGWLRPEGVRRTLHEMATHWNSPRVAPQ